MIRRDISISATEGVKIPSKRKDYDLNWRRDFHVSDVMYFAKCGAEVRMPKTLEILFLQIVELTMRKEGI